MASAESAEKLLTIGSMNPNVKLMEYAVRGPLVIRAGEIEKELERGIKKPFNSVIKTNIGDAHAMGQHPLTFVRQVLALCSYPKLIETSELPSDAKERARRLLAACGGGSVGAYTLSTGIELIRSDVAAFISRRDGGVPANPDTVCLSGGASEPIRSLLNMFNGTGGGRPVGVMVPIPQYPLYSATIVEYGMQQIGYYLDEEHDWALDVAELERALGEAKERCQPRVMVVINPGNPTGQVLSRKNIEEIIRFAHRHRLFIFADEVYQDNVYDKRCQFHSMKKVAAEMGEPFRRMEMASFHSVSKGFMGECGLRGGYVEVSNADPEALAEYKKSISARLCSTVIGQIVMDCLVNPPSPGDPSHELFVKEKRGVLETLATKAKMVEEAFNAIEGVKCRPVQGAMYAFPRVFLPEKAIAKAKELGVHPDFFYAMRLLEETGVCIVPGSGFGQREGTFHFRTTILPPKELMEEMLKRFTDFHRRFMEEFK